MSPMKRRGLILAGLVLASTIVQLVHVPPAFAAGATKSSATINQQVQANLYARSIATCFENKAKGGGQSTGDGQTPDYITGISLDDAHSGNWFGGSEDDKKPVPDLVGQGYSECGGDDHSWITNAATFFGYSTPEAMLADLGWKRQSNNSYAPTHNDRIQQGADAFNALKRKWGGDFEYGQAQDYWALQAVFQSACGLHETTNQSDANNNLQNGVTVKLPNSTDPSKVVTKYYTSANLNDSVYIRPSYGYDMDNDKGRVKMTCREVRDAINDKADAYTKYLSVDSSRKPSVQAVQNTSVTDPDAKTKGGTTCSPDIGAIGWIVCPTMTFMGKINDQMYSTIASILEVKSSNFCIDSQGCDSDGGSSDANTGAYQAWKIFRDYANVAFVVILIVIIISQISNIGISNYGIKTMLPRLIAAAILVNVSFLICQLAVDLSNLLGYSVRALFDGITASLTSKVGTTIGTGTGMWTKIVAGVLAGGVALGAVAASGGIFAFLALLVPIVFTALLALGTIALILVARQAIVVLLVVIAPLAFVLYILPNTQNIFKKWWHMLYTMLLLFPIVAAVFGASNLAAAIVGSAPGTLWTIVALGITAVPLFVVPGLLKGALNATGALGAKVQGIGNRMTGAVGGRAKAAVRNANGLNAAKDALAYRRRQRDVKSGLKRSNSRIGRAVYGGLGGKEFRNRNVLQNQGASLEDEEYEKDVKGADAFQNKNMTFDDRLAAANTGKYNGRTLSTAERDAAIRYAMDKGNDSQRRDVMTNLAGTTGQDEAGRRLRSAAVNGERSKGGSALYGAANLSAMEAGGQQVATGQKDANGNNVMKFEAFGYQKRANDALTQGIASRVQEGKIKPSVALGNDEAANMVREGVDKAEEQSKGSANEFKDAVNSYLQTSEGKNINRSSVEALGASNVIKVSRQQLAEQAKPPTETGAPFSSVPAVADRFDGQTRSGLWIPSGSSQPNQKK